MSSCPHIVSSLSSNSGGVCCICHPFLNIFLQRLQKLLCLVQLWCMVGLFCLLWSQLELLCVAQDSPWPPFAEAPCGTPLPTPWQLCPLQCYPSVECLQYGVNSFVKWFVLACKVVDRSKNFSFLYILLLFSSSCVICGGNQFFGCWVSLIFLFFLFFQVACVGDFCQEDFWGGRSRSTTNWAPSSSCFVASDPMSGTSACPCQTPLGTHSLWTLHQQSWAEREAGKGGSWKRPQERKVKLGVAEQGRLKCELNAIGIGMHNKKIFICLLCFLWYYYLGLVSSYFGILCL